MKKGINEFFGVQGWVGNLHRECTQISGEDFKFYYPEFENGKSRIQVVHLGPTDGFSPAKRKFIIKKVRRYLKGVARQNGDSFGEQ